MPRVTAKYTFDLPFTLVVAEGQVTSNLIIPLDREGGRVTIHLPEMTEGSWEYLGEWVYECNRLLLDVEMNIESFPPMKEEERRFWITAREYLKRFLNYSRLRSRQYRIDTKWEPLVRPVMYVDAETGRTDQHRSLLINFGLDASVPPLDDSIWRQIGADLQTQPRFAVWEELLLDAKLYASQNDYRMAALSAAMALEAITTRYIRQQLVKERIANERQVNKFVREISNRDLVVVGLGLCSTIEEDVRRSCRDTLELRNEILHAPKRRVTRKQARDALAIVETLLATSDINKWLEKG